MTVCRARWRTERRPVSNGRCRLNGVHPWLFSFPLFRPHTNNIFTSVDAWFAVFVLTCSPFRLVSAFQFQENLLKTMIQIENTFFQLGERCNRDCLIICDRGTMDASACTFYWLCPLDTGKSWFCRFSCAQIIFYLPLIFYVPLDYLRFKATSSWWDCFLFRDLFLSTYCYQTLVSSCTR